MNIRSLHLRGVLTHDDTTLAFPRAGLVVVTGENGAGKSAIIEGAAQAFYGESLRGKTSWRGDEGEVRVSTYEGIEVALMRKSARDSLRFSIGGEATVYETTTKARAALEAAIGVEFDVWRRSSVFSSNDAAHFTLASDGERKRLLESILALSCFDVASDRCTNDRRLAEVRYNNAVQRGAVVAERHAAAERRLSDAIAALADLPAGGVEDTAFERIRALSADQERCAKEILACEGALRRIDGVGSEALARARQAKVVLGRLRSSECPTCTQPIAPTLVDKLSREAFDAEGEAASAKASVHDERARLLAELEELQEERDARSGKLEVLRATIQTTRALEQRRASMTRQLDEATGELGRVKEEQDALALETAEAFKALEEIMACDLVLGLRGVRASVLARTLSGLESVANVYLARLAGEGLRLRLQPYTERKSGTVSDVVSLEVEGAGNGHGYRAASAGERKRMDVAMLLALGEVASAAHGVRPGTLFADEVFDSLDEQGQDAACELLGEIAQERCVVVISHHRSLVAALSNVAPNVVHWHIENGKVVS